VLRGFRGLSGRPNAAQQVKLIHRVAEGCHCVVQDNDEFWMYDELKTRVADVGTLRNKFVSGSNTCKDKDSDKMISSRDRQVSHPV
jgi:hypothetical protein